MTAAPNLAPQVLVDVTHEMAVMRDESFGPVVGIIKVRDEAEAIALMNDSDYGLTPPRSGRRNTAAARAIGSQDPERHDLMNRYDYLDPALCWSGCKDNRRGAALSKLG